MATVVLKPAKKNATPTSADKSTIAQAFLALDNADFRIRDLPKWADALASEERKPESVDFHEAIARLLVARESEGPLPPQLSAEFALVVEEFTDRVWELSVEDSVLLLRGCAAALHGEASGAVAAAELLPTLLKRLQNATPLMSAAMASRVVECAADLDAFPSKLLDTVVERIKAPMTPDDARRAIVGCSRLGMVPERALLEKWAGALDGEGDVQGLAEALEALANF